MTPGIHAISNEAYHAGPGVSKTGLWSLWKKTPRFYREGERLTSPTFDLGSAVHVAVLEPDRLEASVVVVPADAPKRPSITQIKAKKPSPDTIAAIAWWDGFATDTAGKIALEAEQGEILKRMRDSASRSHTLRTFAKGAVFEQAAYAEDPETEMLVRVKPDLWNPGLRVMLDLKSTQDASPEAFAKSILNFGYHVQDQIYSDVWERASGEPVEAFCFVAIESKVPYQVACYDIDPPSQAEGHAIYRQALDVYARCFKAEAAGMPAERAWPGYPDTPTTLRLPRYGFRLTNPENE